MKRLVIAVAVAVVASAGLVAQETRSSTRLTTEHYLDWERVSDAQISPDGTRVLYTRDHVNKQEDRWDSEVWMVNADGGQNRFFVKGSAPRWSPDGKRVAYLADGEPKGPQLFVRWVDVDGPATQITHVQDAPRGAHWSPDGKSIAFTMFVAEADKWTISMPSEPKGAKWTAAPRVVSSLHYRQDRIGYLDDGFTHLFVAPADGGTPRAVTSGRWNVGAGELRGPALVDWTPDGKTIVFNANRAADADTQYEVSSLLTVDVATGNVRDLVARRGAWSHPVVSPDGKLVAFAGYEITGRSHTVDDLYLIGIDGSNMRKVSGDYDRDPVNIRWAPDGSGVYFDAEDRGSRNVQFAAVGGGVKAVTSGTHVLTFDSLASGSRELFAAGISADLEHPQDVVRYSLRQPQIARLTSINDDVLQGKQIANTEELWYTSTGNTKVQGWIVKPPAFDASKKYPLILEIHGGPFAMYNVAFNYMFQNFAATISWCSTQPRGGTGYGSAFSAASTTTTPGPTTTI